MDIQESVASKRRKADMESQALPRSKGHRCRNICLALTALLLLIIVVTVILAFTVFKPKRPVTTINSVGIDRMSASIDVARMRVLLNVSLNVHLSVKNPNSVGFKYSPTSALLNYRGQLVGEAPIPAGQISPRKTQPMNLSLTLMADRFLSDSQLLSDVMADTLPLNTFVKFSGRASVLNIFKFHVVTSSSCDLTLSVSNRTISHQDCKYTTKL